MKKAVISLLLIIAVGSLLRIYKLGYHDLWYDEAMSVYMAHRPNELIFEHRLPFYYPILCFWINLFGKSEFNLRFPSTIFGILSIFMTYKVARLFFDEEVSQISALIVAISPIHIWYSQEVREYIIIPFLVLAIIYIFIKVSNNNQKRLWTGYIILSVLSVYINYFSFFIIVASGFIFFFKRYRFLFKRWLICSFFIIIFFTPFFKKFIHQIASVKEIFWVPKPTLMNVIATFNNFNVGYNATFIISSAAAFIFTILFLVAILNYKNYKEKIIFLMTFFFVPIFLSFLVSKTVAPIYLDRHNFSISPLYYIMIAIGITKIKWSYIRLAVTLVIVLLSVFSLYNYYVDYMPLPDYFHVGVPLKKEIKIAINYILKNLEREDIIVHTNPNTFATFGYYIGEEIPQYYFIIYEATDRYFSQLIKKVELSGGDYIIDLDENNIKLDKFKRIWGVFSSWERRKNIDDNSLAVKNWLEERYPKITTKEFNGILIELYDKKLLKK